jgi:hypothetical protein
MTGATGAAGAAAGAAAAIAQAIKASGTLVKMQPVEFHKLLDRQRDALVVVAEAGMFGNKHAYLMAYKGLTFYTESRQPLQIGGSVEVIQAEKIWMPS